MCAIVCNVVCVCGRVYVGVCGCVCVCVCVMSYVMSYLLAVKRARSAPSAYPRSINVCRNPTRTRSQCTRKQSIKNEHNGKSAHCPCERTIWYGTMVQPITSVGVVSHAYVLISYPMSYMHTIVRSVLHGTYLQRYRGRPQTPTPPPAFEHATRHQTSERAPYQWS